MAKAMIIGEVGGSSSRWAFLTEDGSVIVLPAKGDSIIGYNPLNGDAALFGEGVRSYFGSHHPSFENYRDLYVYAAGCSTPDRKGRMQEALVRIWPNANHTIETDLVGAAKGLCGNDPALVLVLGTGMNAGWTDGKELSTPMPSLGYILGDEGSGADIGRTLLQDAFYKRMPVPVRTVLFGADGPDLGAILEGIHRSPFPARALASHTAKLVPLLEEPYVRELILSRFHALAELLVTFFTTEQRMDVVATGSVAYGFRELLSECLLDHGMMLTAVKPDPLPGLVHYHQQAHDRS